METTPKTATLESPVPIEDILHKTVNAPEICDIFEVDNLPNNINQTFNTIAELNKEITKAQLAADRAKTLAAATKYKSAGWSLFGSNKKEAIEDLQIVVNEIAKAQCEAVSAQSIIFNNQQKMARSVRYLFELGVMSIAANRTVVKTLELKLRNATKNELNELARQELLSTINQLKSQEDIFSRLEKQRNKIIELEATINEQTILISNIVDEKINIIKEEIISFKQDAAQIRIDDNKSNTDKIDLLISSSNRRFDTIEKSIPEIDTSFFRSNQYRITIGIISLTALLCSIIL